MILRCVEGSFGLASTEFNTLTTCSQSPENNVLCKKFYYKKSSGLESAI